MSGVNSTCSQGELTPPSLKRLNLEDSISTLAPIQTGLTEQMKQTSPESPVDRVLRIPNELLADIFACLAADSDLETLTNVRLVCSLWKREASVALKTNVTMLPWIVGSDDVPYYVRVASQYALKTRESCIHYLKPGFGFPLQLVVNEWTLELKSFLRNYSSDIVSVWICGEKFEGFPTDLGGIKLPALEHAPFSAFGIRNVERQCDGFTKALAFWKELVEVSKNVKTFPIDIRITENYTGSYMDAHNQLSPDHKMFDLLDWTRVNSLICNTEFFLDVIAAHELPALRNLECSPPQFFVRTLQSQVSLEKAPNLEKMTLDFPIIKWNLNHPMKNLSVLMLTNTTINCGQSPSKLLPNLKKITLVDYGNDPFSCLVSDGGAFEKAVELKLTECWVNVNERISDLAVQLCESFPGLTKLEWSSGISPIYEHFGPDNKNALKAAPAIFSKLEHLKTLVLSVSLASNREVVELITGIPLEDIPEEEASWPSALAGNPRSITNLENLQSFSLRLTATSGRGGKPTVSMRHTLFLFTAGFRTMSTLKDLLFQGIRFENTCCAVEWLQMGRKIEIEDEEDLSIWIGLSGNDSVTTDSDSE